MEKEIAALKLQKDSTPNRKLEELKRQNNELIAQSEIDAKKLSDVTSKYEQLEEQHIFIRAQLTSDKEALQATNASTKSKMSAMESELDRFKRDNIDLSRKIVEMQNKCKELESKQSQSTVIEHERKRLLSQLQEKSQQYELLASENAMNKDLSLQSKKEVSTVPPLPLGKFLVHVIRVWQLIFLCIFVSFLSSYLQERRVETKIGRF